MIMIGRADKNGEKCLAHSIPPEGERYVLESQIRECFGRCAYTHKTHEKMAKLFTKALQDDLKWEPARPCW